ncbi:hypothetical protein RIR_jg29235.t1 [Rhizophagus irregularis DAOM 181602=DAOM 197198]|nr:hypothetical protein RIR_jg29235.t1 [Rhizophagus irregularis DAOM 181602=DAOM 197198]
MHSHKEYHQQRQMKNKRGDKSYPNTPIIDEITNYLSLPLALETENPLDWWKLRLQMTSLNTNLAAKMLFLKRNLNTMHVFASEWDDETSHIEID